MTALNRSNALRSTTATDERRAVVDWLNPPSKADIDRDNRLDKLVGAAIPAA
jgi:hypothetical protein